ncbi:hypothetical protein LXL04_037387 [Taraxacum kok-saghyz]
MSPGVCLTVTISASTNGRERITKKRRLLEGSRLVDWRVTLLLTDTWRKGNEATGRWRLCVLDSDSNEASRVAGCALADAQRREETGGRDSFLPVETKQVVARVLRASSDSPTCSRSSSSTHEDPRYRPSLTSTPLLLRISLSPVVSLSVCFPSLRLHPLQSLHLLLTHIPHRPINNPKHQSKLKSINPEEIPFERRKKRRPSLESNNWLNKKTLSSFFFSIAISSISTIAPAACRRLLLLSAIQSKPTPPPLVGDSVQADASSSRRRFSPSLQAPISSLQTTDFTMVVDGSDTGTPSAFHQELRSERLTDTSIDYKKSLQLIITNLFNRL